MTRTLYVNGCSFAAGSELENDESVSGQLEVGDRASVLRHQKRYAWPQVLGDLAGFDRVVNEAMGAGSNARAVRMTLGFVAGYLREGGDPADLLVCLGITDLKRGERWGEGEGEREDWRLLKPRLTGPNAPADRFSRKCNRLYYRYLFSERQALSVLVQQVLLLQTALAANGVAFHLHEAMPVNRPVVARWLDRVPEASLVDPGRYPGLSAERAAGTPLSFEEWALAAGVALGPGGHPLAAGHRGWAGVLFGELGQLGLVPEGAGS